ncbi:hypothetical protein EAO69_32630 [Streptomyces sp. me109]|nr:hypothetical protein EAO69_32630 [Streptomyces sp. me109]
MQRGPDIGADRTGAENGDFHCGSLRSVEGTEELPNSVDEILSTVWKLGRQGFAQHPARTPSHGRVLRSDTPLVEAPGTPLGCC